MKIHVLLLSYEALIYRIVSITSVLSDIHPGIWSIVPWYLSKDYIEFQRSSAQSRNCPEQLPQMAGLPFKLTSAAFWKGPNICHHKKKAQSCSRCYYCTLLISFNQRQSECQLILKMLKTCGEADGLPTVCSLKEGPVRACSSAPLSSRNRPDTWQGFRKWKLCGPAEGVVP